MARHHTKAGYVAVMQAIFPDWHGTQPTGEQGERVMPSSTAPPKYLLVCIEPYHRAKLLLLCSNRAVELFLEL